MFRPLGVETCCNFKPTIKVVLTEIYMIFIIDLIIKECLYRYSSVGFQPSLCLKLILITYVKQ